MDVLIISMNEWFNNQNKTISNFHKLLQERIEQGNPRRQLIAEETKHLFKLEKIAHSICF